MLGTGMRTPIARTSSTLDPPRQREVGATMTTAPRTVIVTRGRVPTVAALSNAEWRRSQQRLPALAVGRKVRGTEERPPVERRSSEQKLQTARVVSKFDLRLNAHMQTENRFSKLTRSTDVTRSNADGGSVLMTSQYGTDKPAPRGMSAMFGDDSMSKVDNIALSCTLSKSRSPFKDSGYYSESRKHSRDYVVNMTSPRMVKRTSDVINLSDSDGRNLNVTLLDIANVSHKTMTRGGEPRERDYNEIKPVAAPEHPPPPPPGQLGALNTFKEIDRFRSLLRQEDLLAREREEAKLRVTAATPRSSRVNYCDSGKSQRIEAWLRDVAHVQDREGKCTETVEEDIEEVKPTGKTQHIPCID